MHNLQPPPEQLLVCVHLYFTKQAEKHQKKHVRNNVHLGLIGKRVVDFLLVLIELFSLGVTAESLRVKRDRKSAIKLQHGQFDPKFQVQGVAPTNHFCTDS